MRKVSRLSGKFPDGLESFQTVWKGSRRSGKFIVDPGSFKIVWNFSRQCGKFPDSVKSFRTVWKPSRPSGKFLQKRFTHFWHIYVAKAIYVLWAHICREYVLRTPSGKFLRVKFCRLESFDFLCLWYPLKEL